MVENLVDARAELDGRLRGVISEVVAFYAGSITGGIRTELVGGKGFDALAAVETVREAAAREVPALRLALESYLQDVRTREMLVAAVRERVVGDYEAFYEAWVEVLESGGKKAGGAGGVGGRSKKGKGREGEVWDAGVFAEWVGGVFGVGVGMGEGLGLSGLEGGEEEGWEGSL